MGKLRIEKIVFILLISFSLIFMTGLVASGGEIGPELLALLPSLQPQEEIPVIVTLGDKVDLDFFKELRGIDKHLLRSLVTQALKSKAESTHGPLQSFLKNRRSKEIKQLWITNGLAATVSAELIPELAALPGVESVRLDGIMETPTTAVGTSTAPEWNISMVGAPDLWNLGITGTGTVVANMDTGVDISHPDLQSKWRGGTNSWYDPNGEHSTPADRIGHGTQTMGIMVGGIAGGSAIGVAPDARWVAVKIYNDAGLASYSTIHLGFQWLLNPDGDSGTTDGPDVVNLSWGMDVVNTCTSEFDPDIQALRAANIAVASSGGNYGPNPSTSVSPANNPEALAVGAVDESNVLASFSSRGPSACDGSIYPKLVAPGVNIRTSDLTFGGTFLDSYAIVSGTSYSAPHVAGAMALLLSAFPNLTVSEMELALKQSAFELGSCGADNDYGYGLLDVTKAYQLLANPAPDISVCPPSNPFGTTEEGSLSSPQAFMVTNKGARDLVIGAVSMTGQNADEFIVQNDGCSLATVAPDGSCTVQIAFSPTSGGEKKASLSIPSNDPDQIPFFIPLSGRSLEQSSLNIAKEGSGSGKVTGTLAAIDCGVDCSERYRPGTVVTLKALPEVGSSFAGWSGCTWSYGLVCRVTMNADKTVIAAFEGPSFTLTSPHGEEEWTAGTFKKIIWQYTGNPGAYIRIELLRGDSLFSTIAKQVGRGFRGKGIHYWLIPRKLAPGADYKIRITSTTNSAYTDTSSAPFTIR